MNILCLTMLNDEEVLIILENVTRIHPSIEHKGCTTIVSGSSALDVKEKFSIVLGKIMSATGYVY